MKILWKLQRFIHISVAGGDEAKLRSFLSLSSSSSSYYIAIQLKAVSKIFENHKSLLKAKKCFIFVLINKKLLVSLFVRQLKKIINDDGKLMAIFSIVLQQNKQVESSNLVQNYKNHFNSFVLFIFFLRKVSAVYRLSSCFNQIFQARLEKLSTLDAR